MFRSSKHDYFYKLKKLQFSASKRPLDCRIHIKRSIEPNENDINDRSFRRMDEMDDQYANYNREILYQ